MNHTAFAYLALVALAAASTRADAPAFDVLSYDVRLTPDFAAAEIAGQEVIRFKSTVDGLTTLSFTGNSLAVTASLDGEEMLATQIEGNRRLFNLPRPMRKGQVGRLVVSFKGKAPKGLVFANDQVYANYATCDFMICDLDRPGDKAALTFQLTLPVGMEAVAPGRLEHASANGATQTMQWRTRQPRSAYLLGFAAGRFQRVTLPGSSPELTVLAASGDAATTTRMFADTRRMLAFFEEKSGVKFREPAYTQVFVEGGEAQEAAAHSVIGKDNIAPIFTDPHED